MKNSVLEYLTFMALKYSRLVLLQLTVPEYLQSATKITDVSFTDGTMQQDLIYCADNLSLTGLCSPPAEKWL